MTGKALFARLHPVRLEVTQQVGPFVRNDDLDAARPQLVPELVDGLYGSKIHIINRACVHDHPFHGSIRCCDGLYDASLEAFRVVEHDICAELVDKDARHGFASGVCFTL